jgi:hypothetical protein
MLSQGEGRTVCRDRYILGSGSSPVELKLERNRLMAEICLSRQESTLNVVSKGKAGQFAEIFARYYGYYYSENPTVLSTHFRKDSEYSYPNSRVQNNPKPTARIEKSL